MLMDNRSVFMRMLHTLHTTSALLNDLTLYESHLLPHDEDDEDDDEGNAAVAPDDHLREVQ